MLSIGNVHGPMSLRDVLAVTLSSDPSSGRATPEAAGTALTCVLYPDMISTRGLTCMPVPRAALWKSEDEKR